MWSGADVMVGVVRCWCDCGLHWGTLLGTTHEVYCHRWAAPTNWNGKKLRLYFSRLWSHWAFPCYHQLGGGVTPSPTNIGTLLAKRAVVMGTTLRSRSPEYKHCLIKEVIDVMWSPVLVDWPVSLVRHSVQWLSASLYIWCPSRKHWQCVPFWKGSGGSRTNEEQHQCWENTACLDYLVLTVFKLAVQWRKQWI